MQEQKDHIHNNDESGVEIVDSHAIQSPKETFVTWSRIARASSLTISLGSIGCQDQNYMQFPIELTIAE